MSFDSERKMAAANERLPLKRMIEQDGFAPKGGRWGSFTCPLCAHPTAAAILEGKGRDRFYCHNTGGKKHRACPSNQKALDEVGYIEIKQGLSRRDAFVLYLKQAGVWEENRERLGPSVLPGARPRKHVIHVEPPPAPEESGPSAAEPAADLSSGDGISEDISLGYNEADGADDFPQAEADPTPTPASDPALTAPPESADLRSEDPGEDSPPAPESSSGPVAGSVRPGVEVISAAEIMAFMQANGETVATPAAVSGTEAAKEVTAPATATATGRIAITNDEVREAVRWFYDRLAWTEADAEKAAQKRGLTYDTQRVFGLRSNQYQNLRLLQAMHTPDSPRFALEVLLKAGLWERAYDAQREALDARRFPEGFTPELVHGCHPARHFFGYSFMGAAKDGQGEKRPRYEWTCAPLIPYFDWLPDTEAARIGFAGVTEGEFKAMAWWQMFTRDVHLMPDPDLERLTALRPHKHWARGASPQTFLTPPTGGTVLWHGRRMAFGVAALPGISYARKRGGTWVTRHELDEWLRLNGVEFVQVVFDSEEKGDRALPRYNPDVEQRFDSVAWGLALARDLAKERSSGFAMLPDEWRDGQGKADWDGVLARMVTWPEVGAGAGAV